MALDGFDVIAAGGLEGQLDFGLAETGAGEGAVVADVEHVGARLGHELGQPRE